MEHMHLQGMKQSTFEVSVKVAIDCMKRKILTSSKDEFAVVLYNTVRELGALTSVRNCTVISHAGTMK